MSDDAQAQQMRFLITGGAGFIGSHLADALLARGHRVHVLDDLSTGLAENVAHLANEPGFAMTIGTCSDASIVATLVEHADVVYHLAAAVGVELVVASPVRTIETNLRCTEVVLAEASRHGKPLCLASTSEVYGKSTAFPFVEDGDLLLGPTSTGRWSYACSKAIDEFLALAYWRERGLPTVVARMFNTVGSRQTGRYGMVVPTFVQQALAGDPITVHGDGTQMRCFCHVSDVVRALVDLMFVGDSAYGEVFNVGAHEEISMGRLAERICELTGSRSEVHLVPYAQAHGAGFEDMPRRFPDIGKIGNLVGWAPSCSLDEILEDVIAFHRTRDAEPASATSS